MHYNSYYTNGLLQHLAQNNTAAIPNPIYASVSNKNPCVTNTVSWLSSAVSDPDPSYVFLILLLQPATVTHVSRAAAVSVCENRTHTCTSLERLLPSTVYQDSCILCKPIDWEQGQAPLTRLKKKIWQGGSWTNLCKWTWICPHLHATHHAVNHFTPRRSHTAGRNFLEKVYRHNLEITENFANRQLRVF